MKNLRDEADAEKDGQRMTSDPWFEYELEKAKLRKLDLPYAEFEHRLREIAERLGI